ncbi:MAG TPA: DegT/DnrJ/EryC1/StrS family aminotransferase [Gemmatimonadaceae bacterium]|nr:DegT/DnrJ/EryC1/StrS family aminotransferase [Gemmatimonadaceae bacterium]
MSAAAIPHLPQTAEGIPFLDLVSQHAGLEEELLDVFRRALQGAAFIGGPELAAFESEFAAFCETADAAGVASGTDALRFALMVMKPEAGDEVITVSHTFMATSEAITQAGATIRFVDIDEESMNIDPAGVEAAITPRTVGIVPVHLYGQPANMDAILEIADRHGLWVIEDACQAHGARYKGRRVGSMGRMAAFSFYPGKNLGACGEGGAVTGSDAALMSLVRQYREHGQVKKYYHASEGYNGRLDAIQAGILRVKLRRLDHWTERRRRAADLYRDALADVSEVRLPSEHSDSRHVYHLFAVRTDRREALQAYLSARKIGSGLHYPLPLHLQDAYSGMGMRRGSLPVTERTADSILSLPMFAELTEEQVDRVASAIREFFGR